MPSRRVTHVGVAAMAGYGPLPLRIDAAKVLAAAEQIIGHAPTSVLVAPESQPDQFAHALAPPRSRPRVA